MDRQKPLLIRYENAVLQNELTFDSNQHNAIHHLQRLLDELHAYGVKLARIKRWQWKSPTVSPVGAVAAISEPPVVRHLLLS